MTGKLSDRRARVGVGLSWRLLATLMLVCLAGCAVSGHRFSTERLGGLHPGLSTYADVASALGTPPTNVYPQADGSYTARWSHKTSIVTDGIYARQSVAFLFSPTNRLVRLVDSTNVNLDESVRAQLFGLVPATPPIVVPQQGRL